MNDNYGLPDKIDSSSGVGPGRVRFVSFPWPYRAGRGL